LTEANDHRVARRRNTRILAVSFAVLLIASGVALGAGSEASELTGIRTTSPCAEPNGNCTGDSGLPSRQVTASAATVRSAVYPESAIVSNGTVQLGINPTGNLNVFGGTPSSGTGTTAVGLRYVPTNADATSPGCLCEGWGVADAESPEAPADPSAGTTGYANVSSDSGSHHLRVVEFENDEETAKSVVDVLGGEDGETPIMRVTHEYEPFTGSPNLYRAVVTVENLTGTTIGELRYRRVMDWDVEPTAFSEFVTIDGDSSSEFLRFSSDNGFASANPLAGPSSIDAEGFFSDNGPDDHGALFDFGFGQLPPLESRTFSIFYGGAGTEAEAVAAVSAAQAEIWSFGQPSTTDGPTLGTPNTFIFGFSGIGGAGAGSDARPPVSLATAAPNRRPVGERDFEATARLDNTSGADIAGGSVRIDPGPDLTVLSGANPAALGTLPAGSAGHGPSSSWTLRAPKPACGVDSTYEYDIYGDFAGSASAGGERHVHRTVTVPRTCGKIQGTTTWTAIEGPEVVSSGPEEGAQISACPSSGGSCQLVSSAADGSYAISNLLPGDYTLEARPNPAGPHADLPPQTKILHIPAGGTVSQNFEFSTLLKPPADGSSSATTPSVGGTTEDGFPLLYWGDPIHLLTETAACEHPTVTYAITQGDPLLVVLASGPMTEGPAGTFTALAPAVFPHHGYARVSFVVDCPGPEPDPQPVEFDVYIDPSGFVRTVDGSPLPGATVTLLRSSSSGGPFAAVPGGSKVMSPSNRTNPDLTDGAGHFGWDVSAGFYRVRAEKAGCHAPGDPGRAEVETGTYAVPPPVTDIELRLDCASIPDTPQKGASASAPGRRSAPGLARARALVPVRAGKAMVRMSCRAETACAGVAKLSASIEAGSRRAGKRGDRGGASPIGKARFSIPPGKDRVVPIPLNRTGKGLLRKAGKRGVRAKLSGAGLKGRTVTLKPAAKRRGKRR
jgi:hypothetical protein